MEGCKLCECPLDTKARMLDIYRIEGRENDSLTEQEVGTVNMYKKMGLPPPKKYKKVEITCPKWADIDKKYKN